MLSGMTARVTDASSERFASAGDVTRCGETIDSPADPLYSSLADRWCASTIALSTPFELIDGLRHDLPAGAWPRLIDAIVENARWYRPARPSRRSTRVAEPPGSTGCADGPSTA